MSYISYSAAIYDAHFICFKYVFICFYMFMYLEFYMKANEINEKNLLLSVDDMSCLLDLIDLGSP